MKAQDITTALEVLRWARDRDSSTMNRKHLDESIIILDNHLETISDQEEADRQMTEREADLDRHWDAVREFRSEK